MKKSSRKSRRHRNTTDAEQKGKKPFFSKAKDTPVQKKEETPFFQTKLSIGKADDQYEKEADSMADAVVSGSNSPAIQQKKADQIQRVTLATPEKDEKLGTAEGRMEEDKMIQEKKEEEEPVQMMGGKEEEEPVQMMGDKEEEEPVQMMGDKEEEEPVQMMGDKEEEEPVQMMGDKEEEEPVQAKSNSAKPTQASNQLSSKIKQQKGKGNAIPDKTRAEMENSFGVDFSEVNIHTDNTAAEMNKELGAQAFATGKDIYFNNGKFRPETSTGKHLLAHELTHVVQQGGGKKGVNKKMIQKQDNPKGATKTTTGKSSKETLPFKVTNDIKRKLAAVVLAEAHKGQEEAIMWIYLNRLIDKKGIDGLKASAAYNKKSKWFKIWLYIVGDKTYAKTAMSQKGDAKGFPDIEAYCTKQSYMKGVATPRGLKVKGKVDAMFKDPSKNPYKGWMGQGNLPDFNNESNTGIYWKRARQYFWLQKTGAVKTELVKVLKAGENSQFIFNGDKIKAYFLKNKTALPDTVKKVKASDL